jgi:hypothetical protein
LPVTSETKLKALPVASPLPTGSGPEFRRGLRIEVCKSPAFIHRPPLATP